MDLEEWKKDLIYKQLNTDPVNTGLQCNAALPDKQILDLETLILNLAVVIDVTHLA